MNSRSGLGLRFVRLLLLSASIGIALFVALYHIGDAMIDTITGNVDYQAERIAARVESLQAYVDSNQIAATDTAALLAWCEGQPVILMEVYRDGKLIFNSSYLESDELYGRDIDATLYDWYAYYTIDFADGEAGLLIFSDEASQLRTQAIIVEIIAALAAFLGIFIRGVRKVVSYICDLSSDVQVLEGGDLDHAVTVQGDDELAALARGLDSMRIAFLEQRNAEALSLQANQSLITGLSHDLRTPLTKLMLYTEILRSGTYRDEDQLREYLCRIDEKAGQIKQLADDILRFSLASGEGAGMKPELVDLREAFFDMLSELVDYLSQKGCRLDCELDWSDDRVFVCMPFARRLFDNLASNIDKYADRSEPVRIELRREETRVGIAFENAVDARLDGQEGTQVGLANVEYMMSRMGGSCQVEHADGRFAAVLWFRRGFDAGDA